MTRRRATLYGLLAVFALMVSTAVAWSCALWAPIPTSRSLSEAEAAMVLGEWLDTVEFSSKPSGLEQSGVGVALVLAGDAVVPPPPREPRQTRTRRGRANSFSLMPSSPDDKWAQVVRAGWPLQCFEGATTSMGRVREQDGVLQPPKIMAEMGIKPRRRLPLYPRWGLAVNTIFYGAVFWLAVPGPKVIRRFIRRRRAQCPECGYDLGHHDHETCPECGAK